MKTRKGKHSGIRPAPRLFENLIPSHENPDYDELVRERYQNGEWRNLTSD